MTVFIFEPDALDKICQIEGERYLEDQKNFGNYGFAAFKEHWEQETSKDPELKEAGKDMVIKIDGNSAIYGLGGFNRYIVYYSGEIVFLHNLARSSEDVEKAKELGFRIK